MTAVAVEAAAARAARRPLLLVFLAGYALFVLAVLPWTLVQDSWLSFVSGREIVQHGLPWHDQLAAWTHGARWIDQQWLAHLVLYGLVVLGGVKLALVLHAAVMAGAMALGLRFGRLGAVSQEAVFLGGAVGAFLAPWGLQLRAQSLAVPLFVAVLGLLAADARRPSRRVLLVFPLLALWANVHGTVVLGAAFAVLRGALALRRRGFLLLAPLCVFVSPYGIALAGYYRHMLFNSTMSTYVAEWKPSLPSAATAPFCVAAAVALWFLVRGRSRATWFERLALAGTLVAALSAQRSIVWFGFACVVLLPRLLGGRRTDTRSFDALWRVLACALTLGVGALFAVTVAKPESWFLRRWPAAAARAAVVPGASVLADDRHSDWLMWQQPGLRGRIAYDIRFELLSRGQFERLAAFRHRTGSGWRRAEGGERVLVLDPSYQAASVRAAVAEPGARVLYRDAEIAVVLRAKAAPDGGSTTAAVAPMLVETDPVRHTAANAARPQHPCLRGCHGVLHRRDVRDLRDEPAGARAPAASRVLDPARRTQ